MQVVVNGEPREVPDTARVIDLVAGRTGRGFAVAVDGDVIPRAQYDQTALHDGARVEIVTAVQGG